MRRTGSLTVQERAEVKRVLKIHGYSGSDPALNH
jgi:hypothetical protein